MKAKYNRGLYRDMKAVYNLMEKNRFYALADTFESAYITFLDSSKGDHDKKERLLRKQTNMALKRIKKVKKRLGIPNAKSI